MKMHLPNSAFLGNIDSFLRGFDPSKPDELQLTSHPRWVSVHPVVLVMLAALGDRLNHKNIKSDNFEAKSSHYFARMGLFKYLGIQPTTMTSHEPAGRFVPITRIGDQLMLDQFLADLIPLLHLQPVEAEPIRYVVDELVRNVLEHAQSPHGAFIAAQYYPKSNSVKIGVADTGIGIKSSISHSHPVPTDLLAIRLALTPGITGTTPAEGGTARNAGAGLFFTKSIAHANHSFFMLYSGSGFYKLLKKNSDKLPHDPFRDHHSKIADLPYWQGTVVGIDISLSQTPQFTSLLDLMRQSYREAIKERRQLRRRQPRFI